MLKTILVFLAMAPAARMLAQPHELNLPHLKGSSGADETTGEPIANYKNRHEAALAAFQAGYKEAATSTRPDRAIRLFLLSLRREALAKSLYNLGVVCARAEHWEDAVNFQREAQLQTADPEVAQLAAAELERLDTIVDLEGSASGQQSRSFDVKFMQILTNKKKDPIAALQDLRPLIAQHNTRWEGPALAGILNAEAHKFPESLQSFEDAARLSPPDRRQHLLAAAELARQEATFAEQKTSAEEFWEKKQYDAAAQHYATAWENSPERLDIGLQSATGFLMADRVDSAVDILSRMRASAPAGMDARIVAMLRELGAISQAAKIQAANSPGASARQIVSDTAARARALVGPLTSHQMELAAKGDPPLLSDKTNIIEVPDDDITGGQSNLPVLSDDRVYDMYKRNQPPPPETPEPAANPAPAGSANRNGIAPYLIASDAHPIA